MDEGGASPDAENRPASGPAPMTKKILIGSLVLCGLATALSQIPDPGILGIRQEPSIILFYGGMGFLAGFSGLLAAGSGLYLLIARFFGR